MSRSLLYTLLVVQLLTPVLSLRNYSACVSLAIDTTFIVADLADSCLPPQTDCLCYADSCYLRIIAGDVKNICLGDPNALRDTANTLDENCAQLHAKPALNGAQFSAYGATAGLIPSCTVSPFDYATIPLSAAKTATGNFTITSTASATSVGSASAAETTTGAATSGEGVPTGASTSVSEMATSSSVVQTSASSVPAGSTAATTSASAGLGRNVWFYKAFMEILIIYGVAVPFLGYLGV